MESDVVVGDTDRRSKLKLIGSCVTTIKISSSNQVLYIRVIGNVRNKKRVYLGGRGRLNGESDSLGHDLANH